MKHLGLFEGIGGFSLAAKWMGWETVAWCEWNPFGQQILKKHYENAIGYGDIEKSDFKDLKGKIDIITGGFPCQDISVSGKGQGINGSRSGLWSEYKRAIKDVGCRYIVAENSPNLLNKGFETILLDLAEIGYNVEWECLSASDFGAYHRRERIYIVAYPDCNGFKGILSRLKQGSGLLPKPSDKIVIRNVPQSLDQLGDYQRIRKSDGVPDQLHRITALGNAVVPQVAFEIFKAIEDYEIHLNNLKTNPN